MTALSILFLIFAGLQLLALLRMERYLEGSVSGFQQLDDDTVAYFDCDTGRKKGKIANICHRSIKHLMHCNIY